MIDGFDPVFVGGLGSIAAGIVAQFTLRSIYNYALTPATFEVRLFGRLPIYVIAVRDITTVERWRFTLPNVVSTLSTLRFGNRIIGDALIIERAGRFPRYLIVTPDDAAATLVGLRSYIATYQAE